MATLEEQAIQYRIAFITALYKGQKEELLKSEIKDLHRMNFSSVEEFEAFAKDRFENNPYRLATEEELDAIMEQTDLGATGSDERTEDEKTMDSIMEHL